MHSQTKSSLLHHSADEWWVRPSVIRFLRKSCYENGTSVSESELCSEVGPARRPFVGRYRASLLGCFYWWTTSPVSVRRVRGSARRALSVSLLLPRAPPRPRPKRRRLFRYPRFHVRLSNALWISPKPFIPTNLQKQIVYRLIK
ncbi:hypothetical protein B5X24_HaOG205066 [Helicoverpa armigera]|nr:hypothetical protein B5X24_HaOG205066 [Helicoverpa armigera]